MSALFKRALGEEWVTLHPQLRERYGLVADETRKAVGQGVMRQLSRSIFALPILYLGTTDDFLFPESGVDVPFTITTEAFIDNNGYEALFLRRHFETDPPRDFVDTLRWNPERKCITDYLGRNGYVVVDLQLSANDGVLLLTLGAQWLRVHGRYVSLPELFSVDADLRDWYDDDAQQYNVAAEIRNPLLGQIFKYKGQFQNDFRPGNKEATTNSSLGGVTLPGENV